MKDSMFCKITNLYISFHYILCLKRKERREYKNEKDKNTFRVSMLPSVDL